MFKKAQPLNLLDPSVQEISQKYNLAPKVVAYLRAAMIDGHYTKQTLIAHIEFENDRRRQAIEGHKVNPELDEIKRVEIIGYTEINIKFRESIVILLKQIDYNLLANILKQKRRGVNYGRFRS